jgi:hypothetical protein
MEMVNNQYEIGIEIDKYIFNRFVKNKVREEFKNFEKYKSSFPLTKCYFILRNEEEDTERHNKIYMWSVR